MSVDINGLWVHSREISPVISRFGSVLFVHSNDPLYEVSLGGSCSLLRYKNRYFAVATRHQIHGVLAEDVALLNVNDRHYCTSSGLYYSAPVASATTVEGHDICAFEFTQPVQQGAVNGSNFFELNKGRILRAGDNIVAANVYGHAFQDQKFEHDESGIFDFRLSNIGIVKREVVCEYQGDSFDHTVAKWKRASDETLNPDGFSGAPLLAVAQVNGNYACKFGGVVVRGGGRYIHAIKCGIIMSFLSSIVDAS